MTDQTSPSLLSSSQGSFLSQIPQYHGPSYPPPQPQQYMNSPAYATPPQQQPSIHAFCIVFLLYSTQYFTTAMSMSRYYRLSRDRAILQHQEQMVARRSRNAVRQEYTGRILPFSDIDEEFVEQVITTTHRHSCPSLSHFVNITSIKMCPTSLILDVDVNRLPVALYQVQCRCLHCLGPWGDYSTRRCTPLFKFLTVLRVVRRSSGKNIYAQVWEPVSYKCACAERIKGRSRYVIPP